jgi:hypothetical protein
MKSRGMKWRGLQHAWEEREMYFWLRKVKERDRTGDLGLDWNILFKLFLKRTRMRGCGPDSSDSESRTMAASCEHGDEAFGSIKCGEFLEQLRNHQIFKIDCFLWR